jgi:hypothetical protein
MNITAQLSSQIGERSEEGNRQVAGMCLRNPDLLGDIALGLESGDAGMLGDCAEVMTMVAQVHPELILSYARHLPPLLFHKKARVRWEAMHALGLIAAYKPALIERNLSRIEEIIHTDASVIARDWAVQAVGNYAGTGRKAAEKAYPVLLRAMPVREFRHAHHALRGLVNVVDLVPEKHEEVEALAEEFVYHKRGVLSKAAKELLKSMGVVVRR